MASSSSRYSVVVAVSLVMAMLIATSSVKVVAAADEQEAACNISDEDVGSVVERVRNSTRSTDEACKETVSRVKMMKGDCLCELRRLVQKQFDTNKDVFLCISRPDIAHCKPTCIITEDTVNHTSEVIKSGTDFKRVVLCWNTVRRVLNVGDDCFCELRSRVQAKVDDSIDGSLCGLKEKISRCRTKACSIPDDDVQHCADSLVPRDKNQDSVFQFNALKHASELAPEAPPSPMSPFLQSLDSDCCSKVSKLSAPCACEFLNALRKKVGRGIDLSRTLPCMASISGSCAME
ncbi:hypothetical protein SEVIR_7G005500v4 [Setaria viridis]|uniref:Bifunctional inhibitor/plant lipid transfer protein/seed storage helical domain-containing protein n=2 Tax=Setaria TaxID=4554 RepID=A0A368RR21_SETIT|nr:hypothetical protein SETIT_7G022200v2 [Setaria italica]TKW03166.1 hypothetical protein SEVIR_7G005500v2 [Setaria viridis]